MGQKWNKFWQFGKSGQQISTRGNSTQADARMFECSLASSQANSNRKRPSKGQFGLRLILGRKRTSFEFGPTFEPDAGNLATISENFPARLVYARSSVLLGCRVAVISCAIRTLEARIRSLERKKDSIRAQRASERVNQLRQAKITLQ